MSLRLSDQKTVYQRIWQRRWKLRMVMDDRDSLSPALNKCMSRFRMSVPEVVQRCQRPWRELCVQRTMLKSIIVARHWLHDQPKNRWSLHFSSAVVAFLSISRPKYWQRRVHLGPLATTRFLQHNPFLLQRFLWRYLGILKSYDNTQRTEKKNSSNYKS